PTVVDTTPGSVSNGGCMHQKQPPAKVALAVPAGAGFLRAPGPPITHKGTPPRRHTVRTPIASPSIPSPLIIVISAYQFLRVRCRLDHLVSGRDATSPGPRGPGPQAPKPPGPAKPPLALRPWMRLALTPMRRPCRVPGARP